MGSIRTLSGRGTLFLDFRYQGKRCRKYTAFSDTPANRKRLEKALTKIEADIAAGTFDHAGTFPGSRNIPAREPSPAPALPTSVVAAAAAGTASATAPFKDFAATWLSDLGAIDTELVAGQARVDALGLKAIPFQVQVGYFASRFACMCA